MDSPPYNNYNSHRTKQNFIEYGERRTIVLQAKSNFVSWGCQVIAEFFKRRAKRVDTIVQHAQNKAVHFDFVLSEPAMCKNNYRNIRHF